ncbi:site-specific integrase [Vibrio aestuarianus]|uniref:Site-specific integrase n=1 Tax=Vibrio aestuarianus TaxID=28171 RepID=A0AAX3U2D4_9VIBR|nr:site-specific integrase [Vibrio aestuarianus]WGK81039.1 site-specific integrase [Vibrio aestuarianus]
MLDGSRISKSFKTKKEAEKFSAMLLVDDSFALSLTNTLPNTFLFSDAVEHYLAKFTGKDPSKRQRMSFWLKKFADKPVGKITRIQVRKELNILSDTLKPATINRYKACLGALYRFLLVEYDIEHNPTKGIPNLAENNGRSRFLSNSEISSLLSACSYSSWERLHLLVLMAITTGARRSELLHLTWQDIDLKRKQAKLEQTKNGEKRLLVLTNEVVESLIKFRKNEGFLFPHPQDNSSPFINFDKHWFSALNKASIKDFRFHDLRHTCASLLASQGASLLAISEVLGHKSITMTKRYAHLCVDQKAQLIERVLGKVSHG